VIRIWSRAHRVEGEGEFDKVLKRIYRLAGFAKLRFLRRRATRDVLANPSLVDRVCDYMRCCGTVSEYLKWAETLMYSAEQVYPDVNVAAIESFLRLEPTIAESRKIRLIATSFLLGRLGIPGASACKSLAPLTHP
jgi:hypothetical protein